jgi:peroxiredoxin
MATSPSGTDEMRQVVAAMVEDLRVSGRVPGVEIGEVAPEFRLPNAVGDRVALSDRLAAGPVVVVFYRGAWCPYCNTHLRELQGSLVDIEARGASLVAISPQAPDRSLSLQQKLELSFDVLSDVDQIVSNEWRLRFDLPDDLREIYRSKGLVLDEQNADGSWRLPVPATFVIDQSGVVRARHVDPKYSERMPTVDIVAALDALD